MSLLEMYAYYCGGRDAYNDKRPHWIALIKGLRITQCVRDAYRAGRLDKESCNLWA